MGTPCTSCRSSVPTHSHCTSMASSPTGSCGSGSTRSSTHCGSIAPSAQGRHAASTQRVSSSQSSSSSHSRGVSQRVPRHTCSSVQHAPEQSSSSPHRPSSAKPLQSSSMPLRPRSASSWGSTCPTHGLNVPPRHSRSPGWHGLTLAAATGPPKHAIGVSLSHGHPVASGVTLQSGQPVPIVGSSSRQSKPPGQFSPSPSPSRSVHSSITPTLRSPPHAGSASVTIHASAEKERTDRASVIKAPPTGLGAHECPPKTNFMNAKTARLLVRHAVDRRDDRGSPRPRGPQPRRRRRAARPGRVESGTDSPEPRNASTSPRSRAPWRSSSHGASSCRSKGTWSCAARSDASAASGPLF